MRSASSGRAPPRRRGGGQRGRQPAEAVVHGGARGQRRDPARDLQQRALAGAVRAEVERGGVDLQRARLLAPVEVEAEAGLEGGRCGRSAAAPSADARG